LEVDEDMRFDLEETVHAPLQAATGPVFHGLLDRVGSVEGCCVAEVQVDRRPELQSIDDNDLAVGVAFLFEERETVLVRIAEIAVSVCRLYLRPRVPGEWHELAAERRGPPVDLTFFNNADHVIGKDRTPGLILAEAGGVHATDEG